MSFVLIIQKIVIARQMVYRVSHRLLNYIGIRLSFITALRQKFRLTVCHRLIFENLCVLTGLLLCLLMLRGNSGLTGVTHYKTFFEFVRWIDEVTILVSDVPSSAFGF